MTQRQIKLVQDSWQEIALLDAVVVGQLFYMRLFECHPQLKTLFKNPVAEQSKKLLQMLGYVIAKLDRWDDLTTDVQKLALRHVRYGVNDKHYDMVGEALLWTLQKGLAGSWNPALEQAWIGCYASLASAMIDAAKEAELA